MFQSEIQWLLNEDDYSISLTRSETIGKELVGSIEEVLDDILNICFIV